MNSNTNLLARTINFNDLVMPTAGNGESVADVLLYTPLEQRIEAVFIKRTNATTSTSGNLSVQLVQEMVSGDAAIVSEAAVVGDSLVKLRPLATGTRVASPVYIRLTSSVPAGGGSAWWVGAQLHVTVHFQEALKQ